MASRGTGATLINNLQAAAMNAEGLETGPEELKLIEQDKLFNLLRNYRCRPNAGSNGTRRSSYFRGTTHKSYCLWI